MKTPFFATLHDLLQESDITQKAQQFRMLYQAFKKEAILWDNESKLVVFETPSYHTICSIIDPKNVPKRNKLATTQGRAILLHAIAHIEYSAIDLALDACYRFRDMPKAYYQDWMKVADDELRHFEMLQTILQELGSCYGAYPVHDALFEAGNKTLTLLERMAVVPRYMEANGLDANPKLITKLLPYNNEPIVARMIQALEIILHEEIDHVKKGDYWFKYACQKEGVSESSYFEIVERIYPHTFPRVQSINVKARQAAGFSCSELKRMSDIECS